MTSDKLRSLAATMRTVAKDRQPKDAVTVSASWMRCMAAIVEDCADQVEAMEEAEQINALAVDALARIRNDAERSLNRASKANAADNAP